jgi:polysaccharide biosynthesis protein PslG
MGHDGEMRVSVRPVIAGVVAGLGMSLLTVGTGPVPAAATPTATVVSAATSAAPALAAKKKKPKPKPPRTARVVTGVSGSVFGIHSYQGKPGVPAGTFRINCHPLWRDMNPAQGVYDWTEMDQLLALVESYGYTNIIFSMCGTPEWAAKQPLPQPSVQQYYGPYSSAAPSNMSYWRDFVTALAKRYRGRIDAYEVWNEATSKYLWQGTADEMAEMTSIAYKAVKAADPRTVVVGANSQTVEQPGWFKSFFPAYMSGLKARGWPVDAVAIHTYAGAQGSRPADPMSVLVKRRPAMLQIVVETIAASKVPSRVELWDTETNYMGRFNTATQQTLLAHTYLDSWRFGIRRTYWYAWTLAPDKWLGVPMRPGDPSVTAYARLVSWTEGSKLVGCTQKKQLVVCDFKKSRKTFQIAYLLRYSGSTSFTPARTNRQCLLTSSSCRSVKKKKVRVGYVPVRIS